MALAFAARALTRNWEETRAVAAEVVPDWPWIVLASAIVLLTHASLVQCWRALLEGWDSAPSYWTSVRIWTISNFGKYLPGKVWSILALKILAGREGVSGIAATSAAIMGTLVNIGAGFGIAAISGAGALDALNPSARGVAVVGAVLFLAGTAAIPWLLPRMVAWFVARRGLPPVQRHLAPSRLWTVTAVHALSWVGYGLAFLAFSKGITPQVTGNAAAFITVYTISYLAGYLFLPAPGGIGIREWALVTMLVSLRMCSLPEATVLALASRVWITILEITPGLIALLFTARDRSRPPSLTTP